MRASKLSHIQLFPTPWTVTHWAPLSMGFLRQEYWSGLPFPPSGKLPNPGIEPVSPELQADSLPLSLQGINGMSVTRLDYKFPNPNFLARCLAWNPVLIWK